MGIYSWLTDIGVLDHPFCSTKLTLRTKVWPRCGARLRKLELMVSHRFCWVENLELEVVNLEAAREQGFLQVDGEVVGNQLGTTVVHCAMNIMTEI